ncbi:MAG TPA: ATP synthase F0 subunit C [Verrucomicrobiae bacterium]|nr:ATP synthase F0 subunit C [Verrucomicrobiae bacterium]
MKKGGRENNKNKLEGNNMLAADIAQNLLINTDIKTGVAMAGASIGIGCATAGALIAMSRNPGMMGRILLWMFVGMALAEGWAVIAWFAVK